VFGREIRRQAMIRAEPRAPAKSRFVPICRMAPRVVAGRHATALVQAGSQIPATGVFGHLVQIATLPGPWRALPGEDARPLTADRDQPVRLSATPLDERLG
jgi:hypothetical protein